MFFLPPRPFLLGQSDLALTMARQYFVRAIPVGATWRLKYILVNYLRTVGEGEEANIQTTPDLLYKLYDADGRAFHVSPVLFPMVTSPAGNPGLNATNPINVDYPGGSNVKLEIEGQNVGTGPAYISITLFGIRGWERFGK